MDKIYIEEDGIFKRLTWKDVLNTSRMANKLFGTVRTIYDILEIVEKTEYKYFTWNGSIYKFDENKEPVYTGLSMSLLDEEDEEEC